MRGTVEVLLFITLTLKYILMFINIVYLWPLYCLLAFISYPMFSYSIEIALSSLPLMPSPPVSVEIGS